MIPQSLGALYAFLGLVAPGLLFQQLRERARPGLDESAFREASRVALTSLVFTTLSLALLALVGALRRQWLVDLPSWALLGGQYLTSHMWLVAGSVLAEVTLACALAVLAARVAASRDTRASLHAGRTSGKLVKTGVWFQLFHGRLPARKAAWVRADLRDGTRIFGYVYFYTVDEAPRDQQVISFQGPGLAVGGKWSKPVEEDYYTRIVVNASDIALMKVAYEEAGARH